MENDNLKKRAQKAASAIYIAVGEAVADDVSSIIKLLLSELEKKEQEERRLESHEQIFRFALSDCKTYIENGDISSACRVIESAFSETRSF